MSKTICGNMGPCLRNSHMGCRVLQTCIGVVSGKLWFFIGLREIKVVEIRV